MSEIELKAVVAGDGAVGKTCLCISFTQNKFPDSYIPTVFDNYTTKLEVDGKVIDLKLWDVAGQEDYKRTRPIAYPDSKVFLLCFSLVSPTTMENIESMWIPEVNEYCPDTPFVVVGTKSDLRDEWESLPADQKDAKGKPITTQEGEEFAKRVGAALYIECSAKKAFHVMDVFEESVRIGLNPPKPKGAEVEKEGGCCRI